MRIQVQRTCVLCKRQTNRLARDNRIEEELSLSSLSRKCNRGTRGQGERGENQARSGERGTEVGTRQKGNIGKRPKGNVGQGIWSRQKKWLRKEATRC